MKLNQTRWKRNFTRRKKKFGGKVIGHGGFGCVFHPNIECKLQKTGKIVKPSMKRVTKLMEDKRYFDEESEEVPIVYSLLPQIKNYKKYFVYETVKCKPTKIRMSDLENMDKECSMFHSYTPRELLHFYGLLYAYGGENLKDYIKRNRTKFSKMEHVHNCLVDLYVNAIIPMNRIHIYHCDIKLDNMLFNKTHIRIIDWGFVCFYKEGDTQIPQKMTEFPVHYNMPITVLLLHRSIQNYILLKRHEELKPFFRRVLLSIQTQSHYQDIFKIFQTTKPPNMIGVDFTEFIVQLLYNTVLSFTSPTNQAFDAFAFFTSVYVHNVDLHAFAYAYYDFAKRVIDQQQRGPLNRFIFNVYFETYNVRIDPQNLIQQIVDMKYF